MHALLLLAGRALLGAELVVFVFWLVVLGVVGSRFPGTFLETIVVAFHYGATFAVYAAIIESERALERRRSGKHAAAPMVNMWLALAAVALVTDSSGLALLLAEHPESTLDAVSFRMLLALNALCVGLCALDLIWLLALRVLVSLAPPRPARAEQPPAARMPLAL